MVYIEKSCGPARDGAWTAELDPAGAERIVVGTGPGSYAGVRAAIAFAILRALGSSPHSRKISSNLSALSPFTRSAALMPRDLSMRMSRGPSRRKLKPRPASSS